MTCASRKPGHFKCIREVMPHPVTGVRGTADRVTKVIADRMSVQGALWERQLGGSVRRSELTGTYKSHTCRMGNISLDFLKWGEIQSIAVKEWDYNPEWQPGMRGLRQRGQRSREGEKRGGVRIFRVEAERSSRSYPLTLDKHGQPKSRFGKSSGVKQTQKGRRRGRTRKLTQISVTTPHWYVTRNSKERE